MDHFLSNVNRKPVCLVCSQHISVLKEYNLKRHYQANHAKNFKNFQGQWSAEKIRELLTGLKKQQAVFSRSQEVSDAAMSASYITADEIASASKLYSDRDFEETCMLKVAENVSQEAASFCQHQPDKKHCGRKDFGAAGDVTGNLWTKFSHFWHFWLQLMRARKLQTSLSWLFSSMTLTVTEEFIEPVLMTDTTTADDMFSSLVGELDVVSVDWACAVSLATDGTPSMMGKRLVWWRIQREGSHRKWMKSFLDKW